MKTFVPVLALAAGVSATFKDAPFFDCPANIDNKCTDKQKPGFNWEGLATGDFVDYNDFKFTGWVCQNPANKQGRFAPRTASKAISGVCFADKGQSPSFGSGPAVDKFSLGHLIVKPEFDCDLEFHYDMPDGSTCKHRTPCRKSGTKVVNNQCGGARNVTIVYPPQPNKPKASCSIQVPTISFDCETASSTRPPRTTTTKAASTTTPPVVKITTTSKKVDEPSATGTATPGISQTSSLLPGQGTASSVSSGQESSSSSSTSTSETSVTKVTTTSYDSTSTVFTTATRTITQCDPAVPDCPAESTTTTVETIAVSSTVTAVTETLTNVESLLPVDGSVTSTGVVGGATSSGVSTSAKPVETLPCPNVVPSCLNTFLFSLDCTDNTDAACYCPDAKFVKNVYECLYAHGESDSIIAEAVEYFQGICGKWVNENPAIATCATVTSYISPSVTPTVAPVYTTVTVDVTTVVPCTDDAGEVIPSSSSTVTVSTTMTVPQVDFSTGSTGVDIVPITDVPAVPAVTNTPGSSQSSSAVVSPISSAVVSQTESLLPGVGVPTNGTTLLVPTGTGSIRPPPTSSIVTAGSARVGASFGLAAAVALVAAVAL